MKTEIVAGICDFCGHSEDPLWTYPCADIRAFSTDEEAAILKQFWTSGGSWVACAECKPFVDARDQDGLTARTLAGYGASIPEDVVNLIGYLHRTFFQARVGEGMPYTEFQKTCEHPSEFVDQMNGVLPYGTYCVLCGARLIDE